MDSNMTFRIDSEVKAQMAAICDALGMSTSTAFNIFANAFVRAKGMPFAVTIQEPVTAVNREKMLADTDQLLSEFASDYKKTARRGFSYAENRSTALRGNSPLSGFSAHTAPI